MLPQKDREKNHDMTEEVRILTRDRQDTGIRKQRSALSEGDFVEVIHLWVKDPQGRHLLQKRSANKALFPLAWDAAAAGAVGVDESPAQAAVREIHEELGIRAQEQEITLLFTVEYERGFDDYFLLTIPEDTPLTLDEEEVAEAGWFETEEVLALMEDGLFCDHEGSKKMEERLREELLSPCIEKAFTETSFASEGRLFLKGAQDALVFEGVSSVEGTLLSQSAVLKQLTCRLEGKRQHWTLDFASQRLQICCAHVYRVAAEDVCPVCGRGLLRGAIYTDHQINWTPEGVKFGLFSRPTRWSLGKDEVKLADYVFPKKAAFPLHYCLHCKRYVSEK